MKLHQFTVLRILVAGQARRLIDASSASDERDHDVLRHGGRTSLGAGRRWSCARGSVAGSELYVTQRNAGIERRHDERATEHVRVDVSKTCAFADRSDPPVRCALLESGTSRRTRIGPSRRSPMARSTVRAVRGTRGITAGLLPLPMIRSVRWPRSKPRSSMVASHASLTRSPFRPSLTASAAC